MPPRTLASASCAAAPSAAAAASSSPFFFFSFFSFLRAALLSSSVAGVAAAAGSASAAAAAFLDFLSFFLAWRRWRGWGQKTMRVGARAGEDGAGSRGGGAGGAGGCAGRRPPNCTCFHCEEVLALQLAGPAGPALEVCKAIVLAHGGPCRSLAATGRCPVARHRGSCMQCSAPWAPRPQAARPPPQLPPSSPSWPSLLLCVVLWRRACSGKCLRERAPVNEAARPAWARSAAIPACSAPCKLNANSSFVCSSPSAVAASHELPPHRNSAPEG